MKIKSVFYPTALSDIDAKNDNIDVIVTLDDGVSYVLIVATPQNMVTLMKRNQTSFLSAGCPFAFVEELTEENIGKLVASFCKDDAYWLKYYHNAGEKKNQVFYKIQRRKIKKLPPPEEIPAFLDTRGRKFDREEANEHR